MLEMQQRYEGEFVALRAENATRVAREKATNEEDKTIQVEKTEQHSRLGGTNQATGTKVRESGMKIVEEESTMVSRESHMVKTVQLTDMLSFVPTIRNFLISEQFVPLKFKMYDGTTDPEEHLKLFVNQMAFHTTNDVIWWHAFSLSLEGEALEWFNSLPPNSVENFSNIRCMFDQQFTRSLEQDLVTLSLMSLKQEKEVNEDLHGSLPENRAASEGP